MIKSKERWLDKIISSTNMTLAYSKDEVIINNAKVSIKSGEFVFVTGKSGSGKSTFLRSLYGDLPVFSGSLQVCGFDVSNITHKKLNFLRKHIGVIFQDYKLINEWNIERNVMLPLLIGGYSKQVCHSQAEKLLKHVKLLHKAPRMPEQLSGGEQQRVAVARALAHNPILILADEPTGNLDEYSSEVIWDLLKGAKEQLGATVVVVTHRIPSTIGINYKHLFIDNGVIHEVS
jgi:cell division transport system ATP-binding protein